jgi:hypothetical protein
MKESNNLTIELDGYQSEIETKIPDEPEAAIQHAKNLSVIMARTSKMLADAKYLYDKQCASDIGKLLIDLSKQNATSTTQNKLVKSIAADEMYFVNWIEQINKSCKHQLDLCRSIISYEKEQLRISKTGYY